MEDIKKTMSDIRENVNDIKNTGKRGVAHVLFGRTIMVMLLLIVQFVVLFALMGWFGWYKEYVTIAYVVYYLLAIIVLINIFNNDENPIYKIAWLVPVLIFPVFGTLFYLWVKLQPMPKFLKKRINEEILESSQYTRQKPDMIKEIEAKDRGYMGTANYLYNAVSYPVYKNTQTTYFPLGDDFFVRVCEELEKAEKFIFMEYFIIAEGTMWDTILDILKRKAEKGVEVRVMYDGMCSLVLLPYSYPKQLEKMGIRCKMFAPIKPVLSIHQNNRDHRKILVIDGRTAFTGGVNLSDEYINIGSQFGHWKDTAIMLQGEAVNCFTVMFLQMWNIYGMNSSNYEKYIAEDFTGFKAPGYVIPYGDTPFDGENVAENVYMDILNQACEYVHIMTPYLILDNEMKGVLKYAAKRGVDVKIIMPHIPDKKAAFWLARSYYYELISAGVKIYEYTPGFVHAKVFVSDNVKATVGSINLDFRSLYLHFECGVYMYDTSAVMAIEEDFENCLKQCELITLDYLRRLPFYQKVIGSVIKIFAPLM